MKKLGKVNARSGTETERQKVIAASLYKIDFAASFSVCFEATEAEI